MKIGELLKLKPNHGFDHREEKIYVFLGLDRNPQIFKVLSTNGIVSFLPHFALELVEP